MLHELQGNNKRSFRVGGVITTPPLGTRVPLSVTHPGQSKVHLHLRHPLPNAGPHPDPERDEAVRVVLVEAGHGSVPAAARRLRALPPLRDEALRVLKLGRVMAGGVVAQMEQSLKTKRKTTLQQQAEASERRLLAAPPTFLGKQ